MKLLEIIEEIYAFESIGGGFRWEGSLTFILGEKKVIKSFSSPPAEIFLTAELAEASGIAILKKLIRNALYNKVANQEIIIHKIEQLDVTTDEIRTLTFDEYLLNLN